MKLRYIIFVSLLLHFASGLQAQLGQGIVCPNVQYTYSETRSGVSDLLWSVTGGIIIGSNTSFNVSVSWDNTATAKTIACSYVTRTSASLDNPTFERRSDGQEVTLLNAGVLSQAVTSPCTPAMGTLTINSYSGTILRWESSADNANWSAIANTAGLINYNYSVSQLTYFRAVVTVTGGCTATTPTTSSSTVNPIPIPGAVTSTNSGTGRCGVGNWTLTATGAATGQSYVWYSPSGSLIPGITTGSYSDYFTTSGVYNVALTTNTGGCVGSWTPVTLTIGQIPDDPSSVLGNARCGPGQLTLTAYGASGPYQFYQWYTTQTGGTPLADQTGSTLTTNFNATTTYYVSIKNTSGCESNRKAVTGTVITATPGTIGIYQITSNCNPKQGTLILNNYSGTIVQWESSTNQSTWTVLSTVNSATCWFSAADQPTYYRVLVSTSGCTAYTPYFRVDPYIVAAGTPGIYQITANCNPKEGTLILNNYSGTILQWESSTNQSNWTVISTVNSATCWFSAGQTTYYRVLVSSNGCNAYSTVFRVDPYIVPVGSISIYQNTSNCALREGTLILNNYSGTILQWEKSTNQVNWTVASTVNSSTFGFSALQTTYYRVLVSSNGCTGYSPVFKLDVIAAGTLTKTVISTNCDSTTGTLSLNGYNGTIARWESSYDNVSWSTLPGITGASTPYSVVQTVYVRVVISLNSCTVNTNAVPLNFTPRPPAVTSTNSGTGRCGAGPWTLTATGAVTSAGETYQWYNTSGAIISGQTGSSYNDQFSTTGTYYVSRVNSAGCPGPRTSVLMNVGVIPAQPTSTTGATGCGTGQLTLAAAGTTNQYLSFQWYTTAAGGTAFASSASYTTTFSSTTTYYVGIKSTAGCESPRVSVTATVIPIPDKVTSTNSGTGRCGAGQWTLTATGAASGQSYRWYNPSGVAIASATTGSYTDYFTTSGVYNVALITNTGGCVGAWTPVTLTIGAIPPAPTTTYDVRCGDGEVTLSANGDGTLKWYSDSMLTTQVATGTSYMPTIYRSTEFYVTTTSAAGCTGPPARVMGGVLSMQPGTLTTNETSSPCGGSRSGTLTLNNYIGTVSRWEYSRDNINWEDLPLETRSYTYYSNAETKYYRVWVNSNGCTAHSPAFALPVIPPSAVPITTDGLRCGAGSVVLAASNLSGGTLKWYNSDGSLINNTGNTYTTPSLTTTTVYYVAAENNGCSTARSAVTATIATNCTRPGDNYITTQTILKEGILTLAQAQALSVDDAVKETVYVDGFGRPIQKVNVQGSPTKRDVTTFFEYDVMGRQPLSYLSYTGGSDGAYKANAKSDLFAFYSNTPNVATTTKPFSEIKFEASSAGTVLEKGGTGESWQLGGGHTTTILTRPSESTDAVRIFEYDFSKDSISSSGVYAAGDLLVQEIKDDQGVLSYTYTDKDGGVILKKTQVSATEYALTYNVYDAFGSLRAVIQPEGVKELTTTGNWGLTTAFIDKWCFKYNYDEWGRQVIKKIPGVQAEYTVYNRKGQVVLRQNGELRKNNQWLFSKYDGLGRQVLGGVYTHSSALSQAGMQNAVINAADSEYEIRTAANYTTQHGYSISQTYPALTSTNSEILSIQYFDDYDYDFNSTTANPVFTALGRSTEPVPNYRTMGVETGSKQKILDVTPVKYLISTSFYDERGNVIQTASDNELGGKDIITLRPEFSGTVTETVRFHNMSTNTVYIKEQFSYDHVKRLISKTHQIEKNGTIYPAVTLQTNSYNELSQDIQKKLHSENNSSYLQSVDYTYNIKGWLTAINDANLSVAGDLYGEEIKYNTPAASPYTAIARYDGNISQIWWKDAYSNKQQSYTYDYDMGGRLTAAKYTAKSTTGFLETGGNDEIITYDLNGNIKTLSRFQWQSATNTKQNIDALTYSYTGNQLKQVEDASTSAFGFINGSNDSEEFVYNTNGNIQVDKNKGITSVLYNVLNLPLEIKINGKGRISYVYDASGVRLAKKVYPTIGDSIITEYASGFQYVNNILQSLPMEEGRITFAGSIPSYEYTLKDHLGNTHVWFDKDPSSGAARIIQKMDYYAYGLTMPGEYTSGTQNKYLFNGKEIQNELSLSWYDYGARMYDPQLAKWHSTDPMAEDYFSYSPYNYVLGNPISLLDPDGMKPEDWIKIKNEDGTYSYKYDSRVKTVEEAQQLGYQNVDAVAPTFVDQSTKAGGDSHGTTWDKGDNVRLNADGTMTNLSRLEPLIVSASKENDLDKSAPWMQVAKSELSKNVHELNPGAHPRITMYQRSANWNAPDDGAGYPWCASFATWVLKQVGIRPPRNSTSSQSFRTSGWGQRLDRPAYGALMIRNDGNGHGHVAFVQCRNRAGQLVLLGGNQGDAVSTVARTVRGNMSFRFPTGYNPNYNLPTCEANSNSRRTR